jgi:hypothetical protein
MLLSVLTGVKQMGGYTFMMGICYGCGKTFIFNPHKVPSIRVEGEREPVCRECMVIVNRIRAEHKMEPIPVHPDAYEPIPEEEL